MKTTVASYKNGNYNVTLLSDGTKIRYGEDGIEFDAEFPESIDLNITDWCDIGCPFCYRGCTESGKHFRFDEKYLNSLGFKPGMEIALGGGSPIKHPDLDKFCEYFTKRECIPNITVHHSSLRTDNSADLEHLKRLQNDNLLHGVGVSIQCYDESIMKTMKYNLRNSVVHVIAGLIDTNAIYQWYRSGIPVLVLGYKDMGRGKINAPEDGIDIWSEIYHLRDFVHGLFDNNIPDFEQAYGPIGKDVHPIISFDNLALKQMELQEVLPKEQWDELYMGDDGLDGKLTSASMYMDLVKGTYAKNSISASEMPIGGRTITELFADLKDFR